MSDKDLEVALDRMSNRIDALEDHVGTLREQLTEVVTLLRNVFAECQALGAKDDEG